MNGSKARAARKAAGTQALKDRLSKAVLRNKRAQFTAQKSAFIANEKLEIKAELKAKREEQRAAAGL